jgi:hypothetical protein
MDGGSRLFSVQRRQGKDNFLGSNMAKPSWIKLNGDQASELFTLSKSIEFDPGYLVVPQSGIPSLFSPILKLKCDSAVVMSSTGDKGTVIFVCNALRVDHKDLAIDQEPFGIALLSTGAVESGLFLHHGNWHGRTTAVPPQFWDDVAASGLGNCCPGTQLPSSTGPFSDLAGTSHEQAFYNLFDELKRSGQAG